MVAGMPRWSYFALLKTLLLCLVVVMPLHQAAAAGETKPAKHVLVLYSYRSVLPAQAEIVQSLQAALQAECPFLVNFDHEYLDLGRFEEAAYRDELLSLLRRKYAQRHIDVVIPVFDPALNFMLRYGEVIFPGIPVVFTAEFEGDLRNLTLKPHITGAYAKIDFAPNLQLALTLQPRTRRVMVLGGTSTQDQVYLTWAKEAFAPYQGEVEFTYPTDLSVEELQERVAHLPPQTVVYFITVLRDGKGRELVAREVLKSVARVVNAPVYGVFEILLKDGLLGGSLVDFTEQGRLAGELAARILRGEKPEHLPPVLASNRLLFDWRQLKRWGIAEDKLPPGSLVRYREQTLWELYRRWIIGFLVLLGLQSVFIGALLINRAKRRRAEQSLAERLRFEEVLSELSAAFINFSGDQVDQEIDACLEKVQELLKIDRLTVLEFSDDEEQFQTMHSSTAPGIPGLSRYIPTESLPWFSRNIAEGKTLLFSNLPEDLPAEATLEREYCRQEGLKSLVSLPLQVAGRVLGVINFSIMRAHLDWSTYPVPRLNLVAEIFANAILRRRTQWALEDRLGFEELLTELSAAFVNLPAAKVESEIKLWHGRVVDFLKVERSTIHLFSPDKTEFLSMNSHTIAGVEPYTEPITREIFPWYFEQVLQGKTLVLSRLPEDLPGDLPEEREYCLRSGLKSYVCVPLSVGGEVLGSLTMEFFSHYVDWPGHLVRRLGLLGEIFTNALMRQRAEERKQEYDQNYRIVADFTYDWEYWKNPDGTLRYVSPSCERISGFRPEDFIRRPDLFREIVVPEDRDFWDAHNCEVLEKPGARECQFRVQRPDGTIRWIEHACQPVTDDAGRFIGIRASNRDITKRKQGELEIERLKEQLQADFSYLQEEIKLTHDFEHIIGNSNELKYVLHKVEQVAPSATTVLILGETGTGKELVARAIHSSSPRRERPLIKVDCASLSPTLIESELFGHEKGAFTGAQSRKIGRFELAHGSTIFLDEIGELPLELQTKLLRVVQEGEFERLGSSKPLKVDVRIIAATNRDLEKEVRNGRFREDLWYRLNVFPITVPPLRQRQEDIPLLVKAFVQRFNRKMGKEVTKIPPEVMESLCLYSWPGNVRELENVIERAIIDTKGSVLQLTTKIGAAPLPASPASSSESLEEVERAHILQVLEKVDWKIEGKDGAAARLKLNPSTLRFRMRKLKIARH